MLRPSATIPAAHTPRTLSASSSAGKHRRRGDTLGHVGNATWNMNRMNTFQSMAPYDGRFSKVPSLALSEAPPPNYPLHQPPRQQLATASATPSAAGPEGYPSRAPSARHPPTYPLGPTQYIPGAGSFHEPTAPPAPPTDGIAFPQTVAGPEEASPATAAPGRYPRVASASIATGPLPASEDTASPEPLLGHWDRSDSNASSKRHTGAAKHTSGPGPVAEATDPPGQPQPQPPTQPQPLSSIPPYLHARSNRMDSRRTYSNRSVQSTAETYVSDMPLQPVQPSGPAAPAPAGYPGAPTAATLAPQPLPQHPVLQRIDERSDDGVIRLPGAASSVGASRRASMARLRSNYTVEGSAMYEEVR